MKQRTRFSSGLSLMESLLVAAMSAIVILVIVRITSQSMAFFRRYHVRQQVSVESRICMDTIARLLHNGKPSTLIISTPAIPNAPPGSRIDFKDADDQSYTVSWTSSPPNSVFYQVAPDGMPASDPKTLASHVTGLMFWEDTDNMAVVHVTLRIDAPLDEAGTTSYARILPDQIMTMAGPS